MGGEGGGLFFLVILYREEGWNLVDGFFEGGSTMVQWVLMGVASLRAWRGGDSTDLGYLRYRRTGLSRSIMCK